MILIVRDKYHSTSVWQTDSVRGGLGTSSVEALILPVVHFCPNNPVQITYTIYACRIYTLILGRIVVFVHEVFTCSLIGFSQVYSTSQQCFSLTTNQHQLAQISPETNQRTRRSCGIFNYSRAHKNWEKSKVSTSNLPLQMLSQAPWAITNHGSKACASAFMAVLYQIAILYASSRPKAF